MTSIDDLITDIQSRFKTVADEEQFNQYLQQYSEMQQTETTKQSICEHIVSDFTCKNMFFYNKTR